MKTKINILNTTTIIYNLNEKNTTNISTLQKTVIMQTITH